MNSQNFVTVISVIILVGTEIFGVALAAGWAIAGLFELGQAVAYLLMAVFSLFGLYLLVLLWRHATAVEPLIDH